MQGRIVWYRPQQRLGVVAASDGAELAFSLPDTNLLEADANLHGGDLVEFEKCSEQGNCRAIDIRLIKRWVDHLNDQYRPLVNEFHSVVHIAQ